MKKSTVCIVAMLVLSMALISGCEDKKIGQTNASKVSQPAVGNKVIVTIDSLPEDATVFIENNINPNQPMDTIGSTPLTVELDKGKKYKIWLVVSLEQYKRITRDIPEIQGRLAEFQNDEKAKIMRPGYENFFETYTSQVNRLESDEGLDGIGIPIEVYVLPSGRDKLRVSAIFVPVDINPSVLLPLVDKNKSYDYSKEKFSSLLKEKGAPDNLADGTYDLLAKAGITLVSYPDKPLSDGTKRKKILHITLPDSDDSGGEISVTGYTGYATGMEKKSVVTPTPEVTLVSEPLLQVQGTAVRIMKSETQEDYYLKFYVKNVGRSKVVFDEVVININAGKMIMNAERYPPQGKTYFELYPDQEINFSTITDGHTPEIQKQRKASPTGSMVFAVFFALNGKMLNNDIVYLAEVDDLYALPNIFHIDERNLVFVASPSEDITGKIKVYPKPV